MCYLDLEPCSVWKERVRTARKQHECDCCGQAISTGEAYLHHSHVFHGSAASEKMCAMCWCVRASFVDLPEHRSIPTPSALLEMLRECADGDDSSPWCLHIAVILRRWRTSSSARFHLNQDWHRRAVLRQLSLTRRILRMRAVAPW